MSDATESDVEELPTDGDESFSSENLEEESSYGLEEEDEEELQEVLLSEDFISTPYLSENSTVPENIVEFNHSFGYECKKYFNLCAVDYKTLLFASGNILHFYDVEAKLLWFRRSSQGGGIGHITKSPCNPHFAVGEKGTNPDIIIYEWPTMDIVAVLRGGTTRSYTCLNYSPDGEYLCSQGGEPDYFLTVWNWRKSRILRQQRAYVQDVVNVMFSQYLTGRLTTGGAGHIKFWKMAKTFTGLKLMGVLGRFGKTEISDIIGFYPLPDEQVISGCQWGNMLLWNEGLIKLEVVGMGNNKCHKGPITQMFLDGKELVTVGRDGIINTWYYEIIDKADPTEEEFKLEMKPYYSFEIGSGPRKSDLIFIVKQFPEDRESTYWFAQDANGRIWRIDLQRVGCKAPQEIFLSHAGAVVDMATSPVGPYIATLGSDGRLFVNNYLRKKLVLWKQFEIPGSCLLWVPLSLDRTGSILIVGMSDGVLRIVVVSAQEYEMYGGENQDAYVNLIETTKPHSKTITKITINKKGNLIVTGSEDATVFVYQIQRRRDVVALNPIGFVPTPGGVSYLGWKENEASTLMVGCSTGHYMEMILPERPVFYTKKTFRLRVESRVLQFKSVKSMIRREIKIKEIEAKKEKKLEKKREELRKMREENPHLDIDEETFFEDSESEEKLEPLYFPEVPNSVLFAVYVAPDIIWLSMGGYDAGYMYEYKFGEEDPVCSTMIADADDIEINYFLYSPDNQYVILGMQDGKIRINRVKPNYRDMTDYWLLSMHDNDNGVITRLCFSNDLSYMFSCGCDGNTYMYNFNLEIPMDVATDIKYIMRMGAPKDIVEDIIGEECSSLEETKLQAEYDRKMEVANQRKQGVLDLLKSYQQTFESLLKRNQQLPESQVIPHEEFEIDKRIRKDMEAELDSYFQMMHRKIDFIVEKSTLGLHKVQDYFLNSLDSQIITVLSLKYEAILRAVDDNPKVLVKFTYFSRDDFKPPTKEVEEELERRKEFSVLSILKGLNTESPEFKQNLRLKKLVQKYYEQKNKVERRQDEWILHNKKKPDPTQNHPDDVAAIEIAEQTIGDFKLKSAVDYIVPKHLRVTTVKKYDELLSCREKLYYIKKDYNDKLYALRNSKVELINRIKHLHRYIKNIHTEIPDDMIKFPPPVPAINEDIEFPEREFELKEGESETHTVPQETQVVDEVNATSTTNEVLDITFEILLTEDNEAARTESSSSSLANLMSRCYTMSTQYDIAKVTELQDDDKQSTSVEEEFKSFRESRKVFEQEQIIRGIYDSLNEFDESVRKLQEEKINVEVDAKLMELHVLTLHHELIIIKKFEATEDALSNKVSAKHAENIEAQNKIQQLQTNIDFRKKEIDNLMEKEAQLLSTLNEALVDEPFADFLRKIYKKKYKAPKVKEDDESDEESSTSEESSEDEDEDLGSIESGEIGPIKLDETICPEGCNRNNYDLAFQLRAKRYAIEQDVAEEKKMIELLRKETESSQKKLKADEAMLKEVQIELEKFQREKQRRLNEVEATVILRLNQLQYFNDLRAPFQKLDDKLLFLNLTLKKLYNRVGELRMETLEQKERHRKDKEHHKRMSSDCRQMALDAESLKIEIGEAMLQKFGRKLNLKHLAEAILKKHISEMRSSVNKLRQEYDRKVFKMQTEVQERVEALSRIIQQNTEKKNLLIVLEAEKTKLWKLLNKQKTKQGGLTAAKLTEYSKDCDVLNDVLRSQELEMEALRKEMRMFSFKSEPLPPISPSPITASPVQTIADITQKPNSNLNDEVNQ
ncbi:cilia- and flagella-associated protein 44-like [Schistocerca gregaria]|uniref:cilia- and flagella-associated protein 44-like n=1 Tax=Schistocerca gregaria TaxID=7010 RepID=UPI00211ED3E4|nr:cilia- and flagella-associated protein 44-like [Schistocerca gregaria]